MRKLFILFAFLAFPHVLLAQGGVIKDSLDFDRIIFSSPAHMMRGKISGVRVSSSDGGVCENLNTAIRAAGVLRGGNEPLWIVDGAVLSSSIDRNLDAFWQTSYEGNHYTTVKNKMDFLNLYDIESIEVIKDASATALYGSKGANGVIIIKTKSARRQGTDILLSSNLGANVGPGGAGFAQNHTVSVAGRKGNNSYRVSGFFRGIEGDIKRDKALNGGINVNFDAKTNKTIWFGLKSIIAIGNTNAQSSTAWYGYESAMQLWRKTGNAAPYINDYDDNSNNYRTVNTAYLRINFIENLHWQTDFGIDFQHDTRYVWYGKETQFGAIYNGAAAILTSSLLRYNLLSKLDYDFFVNEHHLSFVAGVDVYGDDDKLNTMNGSDFFNHELRARGLKFNGAKPDLREFENSLMHIGLLVNAKYDYNGYAGINLSFRADNARKYDDGRFSLYPAADAWFDIHRFFRENKSISTLKLNGGWGKTGKDSFCPYEMFGQYCPELTIPGLVAGTESLYKGMERVRSSEWHIGGNFGFVSDRILLGISWYDKSVNDTFSLYCFGYDSGKNNRWKHGDRVELENMPRILRGKGLEVDLGAEIIKTREVRWSANANMTYQQTDGSEISSMDIKLFPSLFGGIDTRLSVYGVSLDIALDGSYGNEILNMNRMFDDYVTTPDRTYVERADFLRIGKIGISYDIPVRVRWLKTLRVYAEGLNLATFSPYSGYNPDVDSYSKLPFNRGCDYSSFPIRRTFMIGLNLNF